MKKIIAFAAAGVMSFGVANSAVAAYHLSPEGTHFKGTGQTSATKNGVTLTCNAVFHGSVNANGIGHVTSGSFSGALGCSSVTLSNLPWKAKAVSATEADIYNVTFQSPIGNCGPGTLPTTVNNGTITFTNQALPGGCTVSGNITTTPAISIVKTVNVFHNACSQMHCAPAFRDQKQ